MDDKQSKISFISEILLSQTDSKLNLLLQNMIHKYQLGHSSNTNGIFLNLSILSEDIIDELYETLVNYTMDSMKPSIPLSHVPEQSNRTSPKSRVVKKDTLSLSKFDKLLLDVSKQKLSI